MSTQEHPLRRPGQTERPADQSAGGTRRETCAVCGVTIESKDIEDTNGWRWFNDGQGGLLPLCPDCPLPDGLLARDTQPD